MYFTVIHIYVNTDLIIRIFNKLIVKILWLIFIINQISQFKK